MRTVSRKADSRPVRRAKLLTPLTNKNDMKTQKTIRCSYLYADGHAVIIWEKQDPDAGKIEYAEVHEKWTEAKLYFKGRLIFGQFEQEMLKLAKRATSIQCSEASTEHGSENTRKLHIPVGHLCFHMGSGYSDSLTFHELPGLLSGAYTYQHDNRDTCPAPDARTWGLVNIGKFHPAKQATATQAAA